MRSGRRRSGLPRDPDHLERRVVVGLAVEAAVQRLDLQPGDLAQAFLLGASHPPQLDQSCVPHQIDSVVRRNVAYLLPRVAARLALAVDLDGDERAARE